MTLKAMPRPLRIEFPGAIYHVMTRSNQGAALFRSNSERSVFVETLGEMTTRADVLVHTYCLMGNHVHLVIETPGANLSASMKWLLGTFTMRINRRRRLFGHLFSGRYRAVLVDGASRGYFSGVCEYVHLNPARAGMVPVDRPLREYPWSSWPAYVGESSQRPSWLCVERLLGEYGLKARDRAGIRRLEAAVEGRRREEDQIGGKLRRGWRYGSEEFEEKVLALAMQKRGAGWGREIQRELSERRAKEVLKAELDRRGWEVKDLESRSKGDPEKVAMAEVLKARTDVTSRWIAEQLRMGSVGHMSRRLFDARQRNPPAKIPHSKAKTIR